MYRPAVDPSRTDGNFKTLIVVCIRLMEVSVNPLFLSLNGAAILPVIQVNLYIRHCRAGKYKYGDDRHGNDRGKSR
jgi:hypothetical protein